MAKTVPGQSVGGVSHRITAPHALKITKKSKRAVPHVAQPETSHQKHNDNSKDIKASKNPLEPKRKSDINRAQAHGSNDNHPSSLKPLIKRKASAKKAARPSKRQKYIHSAREYIFDAYDDCTCDLKTMSQAGEELSHAIAKGKVNHVIHSNGSVAPHLLSCEAYKVVKRTSYDPNTIASDILRAEGCHPYLPPLNAHLMDNWPGEWE